MNTFQTFGILFISLAISLALGLPAIWLSKKIGLVDQPHDALHKIHNAPVPASGGLVLICTVLLMSWLTGALHDKHMQAVIWSVLVIVFFGIWDDLKGLQPLVKLLGQVTAAGLMISLGVQVLLFQYQWLNVLITILWLVGVTNAFNFVDSMDGLADGLGTLAAALFMLVTIESHQPHLTIFSTILLGAGLGIYYFNAAPARMFLGDSGAQAFGFLLGALAILYNPVGYSPLASWYVPILLIGVPIFDACLVVYSRARRRKPIYKAGLDHTYHRLVDFGMSPNRAVLTMQMAALMLGALAFVALNLPPLFANTIFGIVLAIGGAGIFILGSDQRRIEGK